jgi:hypothetical protein
MKSKAFRLLLSAVCLSVALWTPTVSLAISDCPPDYCGDLRDQCENTGGQFTQTSISVCRLPNGTLQPSFNWVCEYPSQPPTGDACYGV